MFVKLLLDVSMNKKKVERLKVQPRNFKVTTLPQALKSSRSNFIYRNLVKKTEEGNKNASNTLNEIVNTLKFFYSVQKF